MSQQNNQPLTPQQETFCQQMIIDNNAKQAAIRAGYSVKSATAQGARLLTYANVSARIAELRKEQTKRLEISADTVVRELGAVAFSDISNYLNVSEQTVTVKAGKNRTRRVKQMTVTVKSLSDIDPLAMKAIKSIKQGANGIELVLYDKLEALEMLGKHIDFFFVERADITSKGESIAPAADMSKLTNDEKLALIKLQKKMRQ